MQKREFIMPDLLNIKKSTSRQLVYYVEREYNEIASTWRDIERKAQGNIAIAGIFLSGIIFVLSTKPHCTVYLPLFCSVFCILYCIYSSIRALLVSSFDTIEDGDAILKDASEIFAIETNRNYGKKDKIKEIEARIYLCKLIQKISSSWIRAGASLHEINEIKSKMPHKAQTLLLISIVFIAFAFISSFVIHISDSFSSSYLEKCTRCVRIDVAPSEIIIQETAGGSIFELFNWYV